MSQPNPGNPEARVLEPAALVRVEAEALEALARRLGEGAMAAPFARVVPLSVAVRELRLNNRSTPAVCRATCWFPAK